MKVFKLAAGLAVGYVLGSRAGREKYDQIAAAARKAQGHPAVAQVQQKARALLNPGADTQVAVIEPEPELAYAQASEVQVSEVSDGATPRPRRRQRKGAPAPVDPLI